MNSPNLALFKELFGTDPDIISQAPGRLEILGNHTDYNQGSVLSLAVDKKTEILFNKIEGDICYLNSPLISNEIVEFDLKDIGTPLPNGHWSNYVRGVINELQIKGYEVSGFQALITSNIPLSAGMSSSAALEMALVTGLNQLFSLKLSSLEMALIGQATENNYLKANTGLMDQFTSLNGKKEHLLHSEYLNLTLKHIPLPSELSIVVVNSGVKHDLSKEYNERREQCEEAHRSIQKSDSNIKSLSDISLSVYHSFKEMLDPLIYKRGLHIVEENDRVSRACSLLNKNQLSDFGNLLFESHESSRNNFENSCSELDDIIKIAQDSLLCLGARLSGGGFGGITIHLVHDDYLDAYMSYVEQAYLEKCDEKPMMFSCKSAQGASVIHF